MRGVWGSRGREKIFTDLMSDCLDFTSRYTNIQQDVIYEASMRNKAVKVINLGVGVKRIVSDTGVCPVCKGPLHKK